jgi:hypothetical protein
MLFTAPRADDANLRVGSLHPPGKVEKGIEVDDALASQSRSTF